MFTSLDTYIEYNVPNKVSVVELLESKKVNIKDVVRVVQPQDVKDHHLVADTLLAF